jgi:hypothetical protein
MRCAVERGFLRDGQDGMETYTVSKGEAMPW